MTVAEYKTREKNFENLNTFEVKEIGLNDHAEYKS